MEILLSIVAAIILAELLGGIFHWVEDRYGNPDWSVLGKWVVQPNILHHRYPSLFCQQSYWQRNNTTIVPCLILGVAAYFVAAPLFVFLTLLLLSQMNEIHSWCHQRKGPVIRFFQSIGILQSPQHHHIHHERPYDKYFCVMTNYMNPVLRVIRFWAILEFAVWLFLRVKPRPERAVY